MLVLNSKTVHTSFLGLAIVVFIICHPIIRAEESGVGGGIDSQNGNETRQNDGGGQSDVDSNHGGGNTRQQGEGSPGIGANQSAPKMYGPSPPPMIINRFRPLYFRPPRRPILLEHHPHIHQYEHHYFSHPFDPPRTRFQLMEFPFKRRIDHEHSIISNGGLVSNLVNKANQAFHNLITQTRNRSSSRLMGSGERRLSSPRLFSKLGSRRHFRQPYNINHLNNTKDVNNGNDLQYAESRSQNDTEERGAPYIPALPSPEQNRTEPDFAQEGQRLRKDIIEKLDHVKRVLNTAFEVSKERRDFLLGRILQQTNNRLERTKLRADQILSEPSTSELAVKTLHHISQGINNMNLLLHTLLNRVNFSINVQMKNPNGNNSYNGTAPSHTDKREEN